jgi:hypothetical protein
LLAAVALAGAAWAAPKGCAEATSVAHLSSVINVVDAVFRAVNRSGFLAVEAGVVTLVPWLGRSWERVAAGRVHRMEAFARAPLGGRGGFGDAWRATRRADPDVAPPLSSAGVGVAAVGLGSWAMPTARE